jgi:hypothetical protein
MFVFRLLDSPGLVLASGSRTDASVALRNAVKVGRLSLIYQILDNRPEF